MKCRLLVDKVARTKKGNQYTVKAGTVVNVKRSGNSYQAKYEGMAFTAMSHEVEEIVS